MMHRGTQAIRNTNVRQCLKHAAMGAMLAHKEDMQQAGSQKLLGLAMVKDAY